MWSCFVAIGRLMYWSGVVVGRPIFFYWYVYNHHRRDHRPMNSQDDTISVVLGPKPISQKKADQLRDARTLALESRRRKQKERLEQKLTELRRVMAGISEDHLARVVTHILAQEETLRAKQNAVTSAINENLQTILDEIVQVRRHLLGRNPLSRPAGERSSDVHGTRAPRPHM